MPGRLLPWLRSVSILSFPSRIRTIDSLYQRFGSSLRIFNSSLLLPTYPKKDLKSFTHIAFGKAATASIFLRSLFNPVLETVCPRYPNYCRQMKHFFTAKKNECYIYLSIISLRYFKHSSKVFDNTITSSEYTKHDCHFKPASPTSIILRNIAGVSHKPNGI